MKPIKILLIVFIFLALLGVEVYFIFVKGMGSVSVDNGLPTPIPQKFLDEKVVFEDVQDWRLEKGYKSYSTDPYLCGIAKRRLNDLQTAWNHGGFKTWASEEIYKNTNYKYLAENLSRDSASKTVLPAWLGSPEHLVNLEADYTYTCLKCDDTYCVQIFAK